MYFKCIIPRERLPINRVVNLSKGYGFRGPGEADKTAPQRWEVASYTFVPGFITVPQGDTVTLTASVVNGDQHDASNPEQCRTPRPSRCLINIAKAYDGKA
jgi:hypothetical protein